MCLFMFIRVGADQKVQGTVAAYNLGTCVVFCCFEKNIIVLLFVGICLCFCCIGNSVCSAAWGTVFVLLLRGPGLSSGAGPNSGPPHGRGSGSKKKTEFLEIFIVLFLVFQMIPAPGPQTSKYIIFNVYNMDVSLGEEIATAGSAAVKHTAA